PVVTHERTVPKNADSRFDRNDLPNDAELKKPALTGAKVRFLDLQAHATLKLTENFAHEDNNLATLPKGEQTLSGIKFNIGERLILLTHNEREGPRNVAGIKVGAAFAKLHVLHATHWDKEDALVGHYALNYEDGTRATIPIVCGKDVNNWWYHDGEGPPSNARVGWKGENPSARIVSQAKIRLYVASWPNPRPERKVVSIDF